MCLQVSSVDNVSCISRLVRGPRWRCIVCGLVCEIDGIGAICVHDVNFRVSISARDKGNLCPVRRPCRVQLACRVMGQVNRVGAICNP